MKKLLFLHPIQNLMKNSLLLVLLLLFASCAQIVTPVGGPKDTTPPSVLKTSPENQSVDFNSKTIKITFNEYAVLANPSDNIFFSPPLHTAPTYLMKGKSLIIKLNDSLAYNKTYNIAFANAIKDYTEGNIIPFYLYSFSTGSHIDTFMLKGRIKDAKTTDALNDILILLYEQDIDSLPYSEYPTYITKSQKDGSFEFKHIAPGDYKIFALKDINNNLLYDLATEGIAFLDETVQAEAMRPNVPDTIQKATKDLDKKEILTLAFFVQEDTVQRLLKLQTPQKDVYTVPFRRSANAIKIKPLGNNYPEYIDVISSTKDTLTLFFKQPVTDSLVYEIALDSYIDTITLKPYKAPQQRGRGKRETANPFIVTHANAGNIFQPLVLHFSLPVLKMDSVPVTIITTKKSGGDTITLYYSLPEEHALNMSLPFTMEEKVPYTVLIRDSIFSTINGYANDTILIKFNSKSEKDFGNLMMKYDVADHTLDYIVTLENSRGTVVQQNIIKSSESISYLHLLPGEYKIRVVEDRNKNGKWDTGNYRLKQQPEKLYFFDKTITIRGYWDLEEEMTLGGERQ